MSISVLITTYGDEQWPRLAHERAIPSVLAQTEQPYELIVRHHPDLEIGPARNKTAEEATGEFLLHVDADDELDPGYVAAMHKVIRETTEPLPLFQPAVVWQIRNRKTTMAPRMNPESDLKHDNYLVIGTVIRRELFMQVGGFGAYPHGLEDFSLWAKAWKSGAKVVQVPDAIYRAYANPRSKHNLLWRNKKVQLYWHLKVQHDVFPEDFPNAPVPPVGVAV